MFRTIRALRREPAATPAAVQAQAAVDAPEDLAVPVPDVDLVVYAEDCVLSGHMQMPAERLSDHLNGQEDFELVDVLVGTLDGAAPFKTHAVEVAREEILLVHGGGPRGNAGRRLRTRQHPIVVKTGPYEIRGYIHTMPGGEPLVNLRHRKPMLALTDAVIEFAVGSAPQVRRVSVVIVNRDAVDFIVEGHDDEVAMPNIPVDTSGRLIKDFTGAT